MHFLFIKKRVAQEGSVWAGLLGLQTARFDVLFVYDPISGQYVNIIDVITQLPSLDQIAADETRITALEDKTRVLDENKAANSWH